MRLWSRIRRWWTLRQLKSWDWKRRKWTVQRLGRSGEVANVEPLAAVLRDNHASVSSAAAEALGKIGDPRAVEPLIEALNYGPDSVQREVAKALGEIGDPRAVGPLTEALAGGHYYVQVAAAKALGKIGDARAAEPLVTALRQGTVSKREAVVEALAMIKDARTIELLIKVLKDGKDSVRRAAAEILGEMQDSRTVVPLIEALDDKDRSVRLYAVEALAKAGDPLAVEPLLEAWNEEPDTIVRRALARALGRIGDPKAIEPFIDELQSTFAAEREMAAETLRSLGWQPTGEAHCALWAVACHRWSEAVNLGTVAVQPLIRALETGDTEERERAAQALERIGDPRAVRPLTSALKRTSRNAAAHSSRKSLRSARTFQQALEGLLERATSDVATDDLRAAAGLKNETCVFVHKEWVPYEWDYEDGYAKWADSGDDAGGYHETMDETVVIDCSRLRDLAHRELVHRGMEA